MPGFSVVSTQPDVFIVPSYPNEGGSEPATWATSLEKYRRLWLVEVITSLRKPILMALQQAGWRSVRTITATGCEAILLEHTR
jgi:hypothetical protein